MSRISKDFNLEFARSNLFGETTSSRGMSQICLSMIIVERRQWHPIFFRFEILNFHSVIRDYLEYR